MKQTIPITKQNPKNKKPDEGVAIAAFILNILILPGSGSIIGGKIESGIMQLILSFLGVFLIIFGIFTNTLSSLLFVAFGIVMILGMWIWALVEGIELIKESKSD